MPILNYTTTIDAGKTVAEIQMSLGAAGAQHTYLKFYQQEPIALVFELHGTVYQLPCRTDIILALLLKTQSIPKGLRTEKQALRVAWRILYDWTKAQLAIIQSGMVDAEEVFMPYKVVNTDPETGTKQTMYEAYKAHALLEVKS